MNDNADRVSRTEEEMVAYALEVSPRLLPYLPELLADLDELGSDAESIVEVLGELGITGESSVIDLGCGKGATAIEIASELQCRVLGVDLFEPFVDACRRAAARAGVAALCEFRHGNILELVNEVELADVVIFSALGDVLGPLDETVRVIRQFAKPGGLVLISDGYIRREASTDFPGFENYVDHAESVRRLTSWGDDLIREVPESIPPETAEDEEAALIRERAEQIAARHPELREQLLVYAREQLEEGLFLREHFSGMIWVLRRSVRSK